MWVVDWVEILIIFLKKNRKSNPNYEFGIDGFTFELIGASVYYRNFEGCTIKLNGASVYYFGCSHSFVDVVVGCGGFGF